MGAWRVHAPASPPLRVCHVDPPRSSPPRSHTNRQAPHRHCPHLARSAMPPPRKILHASVSASPPCSRSTRRLPLRKIAMPLPRLTLRADPQPPDPPGPRLSFPSALKQPSRGPRSHTNCHDLARSVMPPPRTIHRAFPSVQPPDPAGTRLSFPSALKPRKCTHKFGSCGNGARFGYGVHDLHRLIWKPHNLRRRFGKHDLGTAITTIVPQMSRPPTSRLVCAGPSFSCVCQHLHVQ